MEQVFLRDTSRHTMSSACFNIWLRPALVLQNTLPVEILVSPQGINKPEEHPLKPGATLHLPQVEPGNTLIVVMVRHLYLLPYIIDILNWSIHF